MSSITTVYSPRHRSLALCSPHCLSSRSWARDRRLRLRRQRQKKDTSCHLVKRQQQQKPGTSVQTRVQNYYILQLTMKLCLFSHVHFCDLFSHISNLFFMFFFTRFIYVKTALATWVAAKKAGCINHAKQQDKF